MPKKSFIDSVEVKSPCSEDWNEMTGTNRVRFCSHCSKHVTNLSEMTRKDASRLVRSSGADMCIRYIPDPATRRPMFAEQLFQITRRAPRVAAGVMSASLTLSTAAYSQGGARPASDVINANDITRTQPTEAEEDPVTSEEIPAIEGTLRDSKGEPAGGVEIILINAETKNRETEYSDDDGLYSFTDVTAGTYELRIDSSSGFRKKIIRDINVTDGQTLRHDMYLTPVVPPVEGDGVESGSGWGGAIAVIEYSLPLSRAVADNNIGEVRRLLASGANPNGKDSNYSDITPLFIAVENGSVEIAELLLRFGADPNSRDKTERTSLMTIDNDATAELIEVLVRAGADVNADDEDGRTPLMIAAAGAPVKVVTALIDAGADINESDDNDNTALIDAADADDLESVKALVFAGATVNAKDKNGETAWDKTSDSGIEEFLVAYGADASAN